jgi:type III secretion protein J
VHAVTGFKYFLLVFYIFCFSILAGCQVDLNSKVTENDANEIMDVLYAEGIVASKSTLDQKIWKVTVKEEDLPLALRVIREHGLPREVFTNTGELFRKEGLVSSPSEERIRYVHAISQELARTLSQIDGVIVARVHPVIPFNDPLAEHIKPSSVSVFIKHQRDANLQILGPAIRNLVLRSVEGLSENNISLTFVPTAAVSRPAPLIAEPVFGWEWVLIGVLSLLLTIAISFLAFIYIQQKKMGKRPIAFAVSENIGLAAMVSSMFSKSNR